MIDAQTIGVLVIIFISTFVGSTFGFGLGLISMPLLALIIDLKTATPLMAVIAVTISVFIFAANWRKVKFRNIWKIIIASLVGVPIGLFFLKGTGDTIMKVVLASMIILFALHSIFSRINMSLKAEWPAYLVGVLSGLLSSAYNMGGPPLIIYGNLKRWSPSNFRVTMYSFFLIGGIFVVTSHFLAGLITEQVTHYYLLSLPIIVFTTGVGGFLNRRIPTEKFHRFIHFFLLLIGMSLLFKEIQGFHLLG
jgi:uncharacterized protein